MTSFRTNNGYDVVARLDQSTIGLQVGRLQVQTLVQPRTLPDILVGFDVETSDWDDACSFSKQDQYFEAGHPCGQDHRGASGHVCTVGVIVFRRTARDSNE